MAVENQNTFFGSNKIDNATKLGVVGLVLSGTRDTYQTTDNKENVLVTFVGEQPVIVGIENSHLEDMAVNGILNKLGLTSGYGNEPDGIFRGVKGDAEICSDLAAKVAKYNLTQNALAELLNRIEEKVRKFLEAKLNKDKNIELTKEIVENLIDDVKGAFDPNKKKQANLATAGGANIRVGV